jgi:nucleotide-binding universal stress UspA family protein
MAPPDIAKLPHHILFASDAGEISQPAQLAAQDLQACFHAELETLTIPPSQANPAQAILKRATERNSSLIVMGTHGRKGKYRVKQGSVAEVVLKEAACPVLVVKEKSDFRQIHRILVPLDGTESGLRVLAEALHLGTLWGAECWLFHVQTGVSSPSDRFPDWMHLLEKLSWKQMESRQGKDTHDIAKAILKEGRENVVDIIVMGTHRAPVREQLLPSSVCLEILRGAQVPLWIFPSDDGSIV